MKHLIEYFLEELSDDKVKDIKKYVDNENFEIVLPKIIKACKEADLIGEHFKIKIQNINKEYFKILFIYFYFWLSWVFVLCRLFSFFP